MSKSTKNQIDEFRFNVRATEQQKQELKKVADITGIPQSIIIREAVAEKVADINERLQNGEKVAVGVVSK